MINYRQQRNFHLYVLIVQWFIEDSARLELLFSVTRDLSSPFLMKRFFNIFVPFYTYPRYPREKPEDN